MIIFLKMNSTRQGTFQLLLHCDNSILLLLQFVSIIDLFFKLLRFEKYLAAEALRVSENDAEKALDLLTNPEQNCILQVCFSAPPPPFALVLAAARQLLTCPLHLQSTIEARRRKRRPIHGMYGLTQECYLRFEWPRRSWSNELSSSVCYILSFQGWVQDHRDPGQLLPGLLKQSTIHRLRTETFQREMMLPKETFQTETVSSL
jgi:hypothetical protein